MLTIYITDTSNIEGKKEQLNTKLSRDTNQMLLYYTHEDAILPEIVLDYISSERIKIKKLPYKLEDCEILITYEIGLLFTQNKDIKIVLWGNTVFQEIVKVLMAYDNSVRGKISYEEFTPNPIPSEPSESQTSNRNSRPNKPKSNSRPDKPKSTNFKPESNENDTETSGKVTEDSTSKKQYFQNEKKNNRNKNSDSTEEKKETEDNNPKNSSAEKSNIEIKEGKKTKNKEEQEKTEMKQDERTEKIDEALDCFKKVLDNMIQQDTSVEDVTSVMMAIYECHDAEKPETIYKNALCNAFLRKKRAEFYYQNTYKNLKALLDIFGSEKKNK